MAPLVGTTQAPRGHTPILEQRGAHRHKASVAAALCLSPVRGHARLFWQILPDSYVDSETYPGFLEDLLTEVPGPIILLQDQATIHHGPAMEELLDAQGRLWVEQFPPYAPELNPVEFLWAHLKAHELANFAPLNVEHLVVTLCGKLGELNDQHRLRSFLFASDLDW
jgi:transposase